MQKQHLRAQKSTVRNQTLTAEYIRLSRDPLCLQIIRITLIEAVARKISIRLVQWAAPTMQRKSFKLSLQVID